MCLKYKIMKIRMKISYMAFEKSMTVQELFYSTILKTYNEFVKDGLIKETRKMTENGQRIMKSIIENGRDTVRMIFYENLLRDGRLLANDTTVIPKPNEVYRAKTVADELNNLLKSLFSKSKASDIFRDI